MSPTMQFAIQAIVTVVGGGAIAAFINFVLVRKKTSAEAEQIASRTMGDALREMREDRTAVRSELAETREEVAALREKLDKAEQRIDAAEDDAADARRRADAAEHRADRAEAENRRLSRRIVRLTHDISAWRKRTEQLTQAMRDKEIDVPNDWEPPSDHWEDEANDYADGPLAREGTA